MQIFHFKPQALRSRFGFLLLVLVVGVALTLALITSVESDQDLKSVSLFLIWAYVMIVVLYVYFLWRIVSTAVLTLDSQSAGYHDCFLDITIPWHDVEELTPTQLRASSGRTIVLKLGVRMLENPDAFIETVVKNAGLSAVHRGAGPARFWERSRSSAEDNAR